MKIFIGFENISSTVTDIANYFSSRGHECYTAISTNPSSIELNTADFVLQDEFDKMPKFKPHFISVRLKSWWDKRVRRRFFESSTDRFDVFIFLWSTFYYDFSDLEILRKKNKKIVFVFAGDDVRWRNAASQEYEKFGLKKIPVEEPKLYSSEHLTKNLNRLRHGEKFADIIFSRLDQGQLQLRPYYRWNMMVDPSNYENNSSQRENEVVIVHAPTAKAIKGTKYILDAFDRLKKDGIQFTPVLIENMPHLEAVKVFEKADIIVDQLFLPGTGKLASEGLAMGKVVVGLMAYDTYPQKNPSDCPIVDANSNTIYSVLKELIMDHNKRKDLALRGRAYAEKYLHPKYFCDTIIDLIENNRKVEPEYYPTFFREQFVPERENIEIYNHSIEFVKNEKWYADLVKPGEREGLKF